MKAFERLNRFRERVLNQVASEPEGMMDAFQRVIQEALVKEIGRYVKGGSANITTKGMSVDNQGEVLIIATITWNNVTFADGQKSIALKRRKSDT